MSKPIMLATEAKKLTDLKRNMYEETCLNSKAWQRLTSQIIESAFRGEAYIRFCLFEDEESEMLNVFCKHLENAGYKVYNIRSRSVCISWEGADENESR